MSGRTFQTARTSRKLRLCESCGSAIVPGDRYLSHVATPDAPDIGNTSWWRLAECRPCAASRGREHFFLTGNCEDDCQERCAYPGQFTECDLGALSAGADQ